ncbi:unnamed protein product [Caenorhabditis brenneri]
MILKPNQLKKNATTEDFYMSCFPSSSSSSNPSAPSNSEVHSFIGSSSAAHAADLFYEDPDYSEEIGESFSSDLGSHGKMDSEKVETLSEHSILSAHNDDDSRELVSLRPIASKFMDSRNNKETEMKEVRERLNELFYVNPVVIKKEWINLSELETSDVNKDDPVVQRVRKCLNTSGEVPDGDPITVLKSDDNYAILSGKRRITACKQNKLTTVRIGSIKESDVNTFLIRKFFNENSEQEPDGLETMDVLEKLLDFLSVSKSLILTWKEKDIQSLFGDYIGHKTKAFLIFRIMLEDDLHTALRSVYESNINLSTRSLRSLMSKFKVNRDSTLTSLVVLPDSSEHSISKVFQTFCLINDSVQSIEAIEPDIACLLKKKHVDGEVAEKLLYQFSNDPDFSSFVRECTLRKRTQRGHYDSLCRSFQNYKNAKNAAATLKKVKQIVVTKWNEETDCVLTGNKTTFENWATANNTKEETICFLFGTSDENASSCHSLVLSKQTALMNPETKRLCNIISFSIYYKRNGVIEDTKEMSTFFNDHHVEYSDAYRSIEELVPLLNQCSTVYLEFSTCFQPEMALIMLRDVPRLQVRDDNEKEKIRGLFHEQKIV